MRRRIAGKQHISFKVSLPQHLHQTAGHRYGQFFDLGCIHAQITNYVPSAFDEKHHVLSGAVLAA
ncbi:hypothetical protein FBX98_1461 [Burkholderia sp. SJZ115]|nr:hypothetical protein FB600_14712 [Burkholderia sp. SJZ089]TWC92161.1 hypothetical protein FBX98_1461 [Burkholderia sp. SJZ115]TWC95168.1 hypothetical protein FB601_1481 [Burkholderia sp. SJZ091]